MNFKIGIFGSNAEELEEIAIKKAKELGRELSKYDVIIITGACSGLPYMAAYEAAKGGKKIIGYSPETDFKHQKKFTPDDDISIYHTLIYVPKSFEFVKDPLVSKKYRNVLSTTNCDAGIIISGRWGTMNEFTNLFDFGKVIGVLTDTGGVADELQNLNKKIHKPGKAKIFFNDSPVELLQQIIVELDSING